MKRITIRWDSERANYFVTEPCWDGGDVYLASDVDARIAGLERNLTHVARQRDEVAAKLEQAQQRIQSLTFGSNR